MIDFEFDCGCSRPVRSVKPKFSSWPLQFFKKPWYQSLSGLPVNHLLGESDSALSFSEKSQ
ncbi:MAG: hypothetical protein ACR2PT_11795, partial [Endozoicomonas sp.]